MKALSIVETAYRGVIEEQDDTILWLNAIFKNNGLETTLLLRANAVNYAIKNQDFSGLRFGKAVQERPTDIVGDVEKLIAKKVPVLVIKEDLSDRGLSESVLIQGVQVVSRDHVSSLIESHPFVWHW